MMPASSPARPVLSPAALGLLAGLAAGLAGAATATADVSPKVIAAYRGQVVITKDDLPPTASVADVKKLRLKELEGTANSEDVVAWRFHYTAFLNRTGASSLKLEFYVDDKDQRYVADQRLDGIDGRSPVLSGDISITEDEGLSKGKAYILKLTADVKGKDVVVASTPIVMK